MSRFCETCGVTVRRGYTIHEKSVFHVNSERIRALVDQTCLTFKEIGERIGVTRERVRQIAAKFCSVDGKERRGLCRMSTFTELNKHRIIGRVVAELEKRGIQYRFIEKINRSGTPHILGRSIEVGGNPWKVCKLKKSSTHAIYGRKYTTLNKATYGAPDFVIYETNFGFLVFPYADAPEKQTNVALGRDTGNYGTRDSRHDWADYLDAWPLLLEGQNLDLDKVSL